MIDDCVMVVPSQKSDQLSARQQTNQFQQKRQTREIQQLRDMNDFLNELDQEIDEAIPAATKKKYKPIQDDFQVINHILSRYAD